MGSLKDVPPQLDLGETLDSVEPPADVKCHLSICCSLLCLPSYTACQVVGRAQLPQWKSIKVWMNTECCSEKTLTLQYWIGTLTFLPF